MLLKHNEYKIIRHITVSIPRKGLVLLKPENTHSSIPNSVSIPRKGLVLLKLDPELAYEISFDVSIPRKGLVLLKQ